MSSPTGPVPETVFVYVKVPPTAIFTAHTETQFVEVDPEVW